MARFRIVIVGAFLAGSLLLSGCKKNKPPVPPPQAQAPTINVPQAEPTEPSEMEPAPTQPTEPAPEPTKPSPAVIKPKPRTHVAKKKKQTPTRIIVDEGPTPANVPPPPLVADSSSDMTARQRQTESLLASAENDVASIKRTLSNEEQAIVRHIHGYVDDSRKALKDGDVDRAYNLAVKAHLLSDSLKK